MTKTIESISISQSIITSLVPDTVHQEEFSVTSSVTVFVSNTVATASPISTFTSLTETPTETMFISESPTSSLDASTTSSSANADIMPNAKDAHETVLIVSVVVGCTVGFTLIAALIGWCVRSRHKKQRANKEVTWSWEPSAKAEDAEASSIVSVGTNTSSIGPDDEDKLSLWNRKRDRDSGVPKRDNTLHDVSMPPNLAGLGSPQRAPQIRRAEIAVPDQFHSTSTTPEVPNTLGPLSVANLMPCDVSQWSRSGPSPAFSSSEFGTPNEKMAGTVPRFMGLGTGLPVPWTPQPNKNNDTSCGSSPLQNHIASNEESLSAEPVQSQESWGASWKSALSGALDTVINLQLIAGSQEELLPYATSNSSRDSIHNVDWRSQSGTSSLTRQSSASTVRGYSMEETANGQGVVHIHATRPPLLSRPSESFKSNSSVIPEEPEDEEGTNRLSSSTSRAYSGIETRTDRLDRYYLPQDPPRLPSLTPVRALTISKRNQSQGGSGVVSGGSPKWNDDGTFAEVLREKRWTGASNGSEGRMLSRDSTVSHGGFSSDGGLSRSSTMDPAERRASRVLLMRRKRASAIVSGTSGNGVVGSSVGVGRGSSRNSLSSLKRSISKHK